MNSNGRSWLISFGDLLTLLLCFFLTIVSFGPLHPEYQGPPDQVNAQNNSKNSTNQPQLADSGGSGIRIAESIESDLPSELSGSSSVLYLKAADFTDNNRFIGSETLTEIKKLIGTVDYPQASFEIETCSGIQDLQITDHWQVARSRALAIKSQVIDAQLGKSGKTFSLKVLGAECQMIENANSVSSDVVASLRVYRSNG